MDCKNGSEANGGFQKKWKFVVLRRTEDTLRWGWMWQSDDGEWRHRQKMGRRRLV